MSTEGDNVSGSVAEKVSEEYHQTENRIDEAAPFIDEQRMFRKVDLHLLIPMMITYGLQFMDKLALSSASIFGMRDDLGLVGKQYSWTSSIFYFGFFLGNLCVARLVNIVPIGKFVAIAVCFWGITLACTAACTNYAGLCVARFFLGFLESAVSPCFVFITSMWWKRDQQPLRTGFWFAGNDIGAIVGSFASFGIGHITSMAAWKVIFMIYGLVTFAWSFALYFLLPDSPETCNFLTEDEKAYYREEMVQSKIEHNWSWSQAKEAALDINMWFLSFATVLCILPNGGMTSYGLLILDAFGFTSIQSTLVNLPASILAWIAIVATGYVASHYRNQRVCMIFAVTIFSIIGGCLCYKGASKGVKLTGYYFLAVQPAVFPQVLAMAASNFRGTTRRAIINSFLFILYCASNIGGPQLFSTDDAPLYTTAFRSWIICFCILCGLCAAIIAKYRYDNKKQEEKDQSVVVDSDNVAEFHDPTFRYRY